MTITSPHKRKDTLTAKVASVGGVQTRVLEGPGSGPTVLLLHGFSDSADGWRDVLGELAKSGHHGVAVDLPHFGRAGRPRSSSVLAALDEFVEAAAREYDTGQGVVLVGNSIGGLAALRAARRTDLPIVSVLAIGPAGLIVPWWMTALTRTRPLLDRVLTLPSPALVHGTVAGPAIMGNLFARAVASGHLSARAKSRYASHWGPGDLRRQLVLGGQTLAELADPHALDNAEFQMPVTLAWGDKDWIFSPRAGARLQQLHPDVRLRSIAGSGHCPQYDNPNVVADLIRKCTGPTTDSTQATDNKGTTP
jgi:pimeloyl-ACP methyl ester carboxylesterase